MITFKVGATFVDQGNASAACDLRYDPADPISIKLVFHERDGDVDWWFSRELLEEGLRNGAGLGDVRMWPSGQFLMVAFSSPDGNALLRFNREPVVRFLAATYRAVPKGRERVDVDGWIGELLDGAL